MRTDLQQRAVTSIKEPTHRPRTDPMRTYTLAVCPRPPWPPPGQRLTKRQSSKSSSRTYCVSLVHLKQVCMSPRSPATCRLKRSQQEVPSDDLCGKWSTTPLPPTPPLSATYGRMDWTAQSHPPRFQRSHHLQSVPYGWELFRHTSMSE